MSGRHIASPGVRVGPSYCVPGDAIWRPDMKSRKWSIVTALVRGPLRGGLGIARRLCPARNASWDDITQRAMHYAQRNYNDTQVSFNKCLYSNKSKQHARENDLQTQSGA